MSESSTEPAVGVCGFGRCGSTMAMRMLVAGGVPAVDGAAEPPHELGDPFAAWQVPLAGRCVKLLDIFREHGLPRAPSWRFLWLDRDPAQQALSQAKFLDWMFGSLGENPRDVAARFETSYARDRPRALGQLHGAGRVLVLDYGHVLADPLYAARRMRAALWPALAVDAAAAVVHKRDARCLPDLAVEMALTGGG